MIHSKNKSDAPDCATMSGCMLQGDLTTENLLPAAVVIVGDSRVGKSTLFNHLKGIPMKGEEDSHGDITLKAMYNEGVDAESSFTSVTLIPNISSIKTKEGEIGLCDTAGFADEGRTHVEVFGVSYLLHKILNRLTKIKFILAISHTKFEEGQVADFLRPIENFLRMINVDALINNEEVAEAVINSIAFVVIKSTKELKRYVGRTNKAIDYLKAQGGNLSNEKKIILRILQSVKDKNRIEVFPEAEDNVTIEKSEIIKSLSESEKNWNFYDSEENLDNGMVFNLPLKDDFEKLPDLNKQKYRKENEEKKKFLENSFNLMKRFVVKGIENCHKPEVDFNEEFIELERLIENHPYGKFETMTKLLKIEPIKSSEKRSISRLEFLNKLEELYAQTVRFNEANEEEGEIAKIEKIYDPCFKTFDICRKTFCRTAEEEKKFIIFMFMNLRSIKENLIQVKIHAFENSGHSFVVSNILSKIIPEPIYDLKASFIENFNPRSDEREKFETLLEDIVKNLNEVTDPSKARDVLKWLIKSSILKANDFILEKKYQDGLLEMVKANGKFQEYVESLPDESDREDNVKEFCEFKQFEIFKKIGLCLEGMKLNSLAIEVYQHTQSVHLENKCHKRIISESINKKKKFENMKEYASFLEEKGKREKLIDLYEEMIDEFEFFPAERREIKDKLASVLESAKCGDWESIYATNLGSTESMCNNQGLIDKIVDEIGLYFDLKEEKIEEDLDDVFNHRNESDEESGDDKENDEDDC